MKTNLRQLIDDTLIYVSQKENAHHIKKALKVFTGPFGDQETEIDREYGFNSWLIHNYEVTENKYFVNYVTDDDNLKNMIINSSYSIYRVQNEQNNIVFKDVVTGEDYIVDTDQIFNQNDLVKVRLYPFESKYIILDNPEFYDPELEKTIRKSLMTKYNEYCSMNEPMSIIEFAKKNTQMIYHMTNIINYYEAQLLNEDEYQVFVATYAISNKEAVLDALLDSNDFQLLEVDGDETIIDLVSDGVQLAELVVGVNTVEIEVMSKPGLDLAKDTFEEHLKDLAVFVKEDLLSIEDLL